MKTFEVFAALPAVEAFFYEPFTDEHGKVVQRPRMRPLKMVWIEPDEPRGWIIDGFWWTKAEDENGQLVRVRGRHA